MILRLGAVSTDNAIILSSDCEKDIGKIDECITITKEYNSRTEFKRGNFKVYSYSYYMGWMNKLARHNLWRLDIGNEMSDEQLLIIAKNYTTRKSFQLGSRKAYNCARVRRLLDGIYGLGKRVEEKAMEGIR